VHDLSPAERTSSEASLPFAEVGCDVQLASQRVLKTEAEGAAAVAARRAATELAGDPSLSDAVIYACDYAIDDNPLAELLDRVLAPTSPLRRLL
jgi:hypothetical protein